MSIRSDMSDEELAISLSDDELENLKETQLPSGNIHKFALKEIYKRKKDKDTKDANTQNKIKQYAFWTLLVGIAVLIITLAQLGYVYIIQPYFVQKSAHVSQTNHKEANHNAPIDTASKQNDTIR